MGNEFPFGECECRGGGCRCEGSAGPAAYVVTRQGRDLRVCTRCDLSTDHNKRPLATAETPMEVFDRYDSLGAFCLSIRISGAES